MPSTSRRSSQRDGSHRASAIREELEQLLALGDASDGDEAVGKAALNDKRRKSKKIQYNKRQDDDSKETTNDDTQSKNSKKSARSKKSHRSRSSKESTDESRNNNNEIERKSTRSKSPKRNRSGKESRKIRYTRTTETAEERDRDMRSYRSKESKGSRASRRSSHRKSTRPKTTTDDDKNGETNARNNSEVLRSKRSSYRRKDISPHSNESKEAKRNVSRRNSNSRRNSSSKQSESNRRSWSLGDFEKNDWPSSDEEDAVGLRDDDLDDEGEFGLDHSGELGLNDVDGKDDSAKSGGDRKARPRRMKSIERPSRGDMKRSSSTGAMDTKLNSSFRRQARRPSGNIKTDMVLGDPSRRAPPTRSKSNDVASNWTKSTDGFSSSRILKRGERRSMARSNSHDFGEYLRNQGVTHNLDQSFNRIHKSDHTNNRSKGENDKENPFEVMYQSYNLSDSWDPFSEDKAEERSNDVNNRSMSLHSENWDPFASEESAEEEYEDTKERRGNLRPTRSGGLLQTSSKDTISRLPVGANVRKSCAISNMGAITGTSGDLPYGHTGITNNNNNVPGVTSKTDREKQRRADYKKSIAAAAMAGRRLSSNPKPSQRQSRTVRKFDESVKQLEGALQRAR